MAGRVEMREGVSMCRVLATPHMTACKANAKFIPCRALRQAFLAAIGAGLHILNRVEMLAALIHVGNCQAPCRAPRTGRCFCMFIPVIR